MPDAPLSRRARRDMEAQAAERAAAQNDPNRANAQGPGVGEIAAADADSQAVSRRDRRRLERLARPMESWTAEEEMIATGQIPTMTPERIAEQERLAREAAERAASDAQTASSELRILAQRDLSPQSPDESSTPPVRVSRTDVPLVQPAPRPDAHAPLEEREIVEPYSPRFEFDDREPESAPDESPDVEIPTGFDPEAKIERTPAPTGEPDPHDAGDHPIAWPESFDSILAPSSEETRPPSVAPVPQASAAEAPLAEASEAEAAEASEAETSFAQAAEPPVAAAPAESVPTEAVEREAEAAAARAKVFEELFPPGSSQAALLEHDRLARESSASAPAPDDDEAAERQRGIEEIRRLTEAAIRSFETKAHPQDESTEPGLAQSEAFQPERADRYEMPADTDEEYTFQGFGAQVSPTEREQQEASPMPDPGSLAPPSGQFPTTSAPHQAAFDEAVRTASTEIPVRPMNQPQPTQEEEPSPWGTHPLDAARGSVPNDVNDFQPISNAPRPDLSQVNNRPPTGQFPTTSGQFPTTSGQFPTTGALFTSDPSATGQIAPLRRVPELPPVGGPGHFRWHHLAVIGALVFVLGVIIYNVWLGK